MWECLRLNYYLPISFSIVFSGKKRKRARHLFDPDFSDLPTSRRTAQSSISEGQLFLRNRIYDNIQSSSSNLGRMSLEFTFYSPNFAKYNYTNLLLATQNVVREI